MRKVFVGGMASLLLIGCTQQGTGDAALKAQVEKLDARLSTTEAELNDLKNKQQSTDGEVLGLKLNAQAGQMAVFDPVSGQGYVAMDAGVGKLMVSIEDIEPYADGVKVRLAVGNPNAVTLNGLRGEATYGPASSRIGAIPMTDEFNIAGKDWFTEQEAAFYCCVSASQFAHHYEELGITPRRFMGKKLYAREELSAVISRSNPWHVTQQAVGTI